MNSHSGKNAVRIALVGDFNAAVKAHVAIPKALEMAAREVGVATVPAWVHTTSLGRDMEQALTDFDAIWCVPASPYASMSGALGAIWFAREKRRPFLGTCGGFQHAILEFTRNVLGHLEADHAESNPNASLPIISPLSCSLVEASGRIRFKRGSRIAQIYGGLEATEEYHCNYGVNPQFRSLLEDSTLKITGTDERDEARVVELEDHPFFVGTLFQPERSAFKSVLHPLITEFVRATAERKTWKTG